MTGQRSFLGNVDARDVVVLSGVVLITVGAGMIYLAAAPIVAGVMLLGVGVFGLPRWN